MNLDRIFLANSKKRTANEWSIQIDRNLEVVLSMASFACTWHQRQSLALLELVVKSFGGRVHNWANARIWVK